MRRTFLGTVNDFVIGLCYKTLKNETSKNKTSNFRRRISKRRISKCRISNPSKVTKGIITKGRKLQNVEKGRTSQKAEKGRKIPVGFFLLVNSVETNKNVEHYKSWINNESMNYLDIRLG
jgi:hypothetical protein